MTCKLCLANDPKCKCSKSVKPKKAPDSSNDMSQFGFRGTCFKCGKIYYDLYHRCHDPRKIL